MIDIHPTSSNGRKQGGPSRRQRRDRRYTLVVGVMFTLIFGASISALTASLSTSRCSPGPGEKSPASDPDGRTAKIIDPTNSKCRLTSFDNGSGRVSDAGKPCKGSGDPTRTGTERRLDAISESFSNNK
jgi:hypothetical protein